jgi:deoxyribonuclease V
MHIHRRHDWNLTPEQAVALQKQLVSELIVNQPIALDDVRLVAGVDVSVKNDLSRAAVVVLAFPDLLPVEIVTYTLPTPFPYIPGLLSFREGPVLETAFERLQHVPDVFIFDGMGIAHPRRIGIASHLGLWLQKPTVGCGKTLLIGHYAEPGSEKGAYSHLTDRGETIGAVVRTRTGVKPVYISPGHLADLPTSIDLILRCAIKYRLPEPIRHAHNAAGDFEA